MNAEGDLLTLAERHGIDPGYHDLWGTWHPLKDSTARTILAAMGVATGDDQAVQHALANADNHRWNTPLPPVVVISETAAAMLEICLPATSGNIDVRWRLHLEEGGQCAGNQPAWELEFLGERGLGGEVIHRRSLQLADDLPLGYHRLYLDAGNTHAETTVVVTPRHCKSLPAKSDGSRHWGIALQLYSLRSATNWGIGDFGDLLTAIDLFAGLGADMVGLNPLHALFPDAPGQTSPYSPSSRKFLNPAYLRVETVEDFAECDAAREAVASEAFQAQLAALRASELVDYAQAIPLKLAVLRQLYEHFRDRHLATRSVRAQAYQVFCDSQGSALHRHAVFEVLHAHHAKAPGGGLPGEFDDPGSEAVSTFAREHSGDVAFAVYLQWQCALQLNTAVARSRDKGMSIGLYLDLAVGSDGRGADVWAEPDLHARNVSIGAPPDDFSQQGQVWGLPPWPPAVLREQAYRPFVQCLRASMQAAGALRIDHVLGLLRLFWVPSASDAADGAYVHYPVSDLLAIAALESRRAGCVIVGEDLGTVPDQLREALADYGVLSYRVLYFEKHWHGDHSFRQPEHYPEQALVTVSTHDLATLVGYWTGHDLDLRGALELFPSPAAEANLRDTRHHDRWRLLDALGHQGLRPELNHEPGIAPPDANLVQAVHRFLARSPAALLSVQMEDVLGEREQVNVPGTVSGYPNWRRKLSLPVESWQSHKPLLDLAAAVSLERGGHRVASA